MSRLFTPECVGSAAGTEKMALRFSSDRNGFKASDHEALEKFANMIRQMKKDGVRF